MNDDAPGCPICSRDMLFCDPSHEKAYWACPARHEPPGIVQQGKEVGYSFALARIRIMDKFNEHGVEPFADVETAEDVPGIATNLALDRLQHCVEHKRLRQREGHDDLPDQQRNLNAEQSGLEAFTDGGQP